MKVKRQPREKTVEDRSAKEINIELHQKIQDLERELSSIKDSKSTTIDQADLSAITTELENQKEEEITRLRDAHKRELDALRVDLNNEKEKIISDYESKLEMAQNSQNVDNLAINDLTDRHQKELEELKSKHQSEIHSIRQELSSYSTNEDASPTLIEELNKSIDKLKRANENLREKNKNLKNEMSQGLELVSSNRALGLVEFCSPKTKLCLQVVEKACHENGNDWTRITLTDFQLNGIPNSIHVSKFKEQASSLGLIHCKIDYEPKLKREVNFFKKGYEGNLF